MRRIAILDAPSNLGLRPPTETSVPGCAKAPGALRDHGLLARLGARDAGCLTPPRYDPGDWRPGDGVCHAAEISAYSRKLADRIGAIIDTGEFPVILGGDCSILLGSGLAMHRLGDAVGGRIGLVFVDGHSDFRHPGNASYVGAAAGEDLALVTGRGQTDLAAMEGRRPYFRDIDVVVLGIRAQDEYRLDLQAAGIVTRPVPMLRVEGAARSAQWARDQLVDCAGYWVHVDMDVLDPAVMPAVDAPEPGGIAFPELELLLAGLVDTPHCLGVEITVFDPDYDPDGGYAEEITSALVAGLTPVRHVDARPDLVAARADLAAPGTTGRPRRSTAPGRLRPAAGAPREADAAPEAATDAAGAEADWATARDSGSEAGSGAEWATAHDSGSEAVAAADWVAARDAEAVGVAAADWVAARGSGSEAVAAADWATARDADAVAAADWVAARDGDDEVAESAGGSQADLVAEPIAHSPVLAAGFDWAADDEVTEIEATDSEPAGPTSIADEAQDETADEAAGLGFAGHNGSDHDLRPATRPLGSAPLLDSEPLPATRPGMLRPRQADGFSLPTQRPAFDIGPEEPADIA